MLTALTFDPQWLHHSYDSTAQQTTGSNVAPCCPPMLLMMPSPGGSSSGSNVPSMAPPTSSPPRHVPARLLQDSQDVLDTISCVCSQGDTTTCTWCIWSSHSFLSVGRSRLNTNYGRIKGLEVTFGTFTVTLQWLWSVLRCLEIKFSKKNLSFLNVIQNIFGAVSLKWKICEDDGENNHPLQPNGPVSRYQAFWDWLCFQGLYALCCSFCKPVHEEV